MDEASGTRADSVASNDLTDSNTVGSASGMFANAGDFERDNSESLTLADNDDVSLGDVSFMFRAWVRLESKTGAQTILAKWGASNGVDREYWLRYFATPDRFEFVVDDGSGSFPTVSADNLGSPSTGTWYLIHAWHDASANQIGIAVNAGTANTTSWSAGVLAGSGMFRLGAVDESGGNHFLDGLLDDVVLLEGYILDSIERAADYNDAMGVPFEDWAGGGGGGTAFPWHHYQQMMAG
jgi:hypothetical protein